MIDSFDFLDFVNKSAETKLAFTTSYKLNLFLSEGNKMFPNDSYSTKDEDENDLNFESGFFGIMNVSSKEEEIPSIVLKEEKTEDDSFAHYFKRQIQKMNFVARNGNYLRLIIEKDLMNFTIWKKNQVLMRKYFLKIKCYLL